MVREDNSGVLYPHARKDMTLGFDFWIQLIVVLAALFYGARKGGMGLGLIGGIGLILHCRRYCISSYCKSECR